jgi:hypothetical protein
MFTLLIQKGITCDAKYVFLSHNMFLEHTFSLENVPKILVSY